MQHSRAITRKSASNLALAFILLPQPKRDAMSALYAFCREVDDVADEDAVPVEKRREQLASRPNLLQTGNCSRSSNNSDCALNFSMN
jgi:phytoene/squalene synthetase